MRTAIPTASKSKYRDSASIETAPIKTLAGMKLISKLRIMSRLSAPFGTRSSDVQHGMHILYRIFIHYSQYPFPATNLWEVSLDPYCRGVLLLAGLYKWPTQPGFTMPCRCGNYNGISLTYRAGSPADERRQMFRFMASYAHPSIVRVDKVEKSPITWIGVQQFAYSTTKNNPVITSTDDLPLSDNNMVMGDEDERDIDLLDVLLQTHPRKQELMNDDFDSSILTDGPYRDSFSFVLPTLPRQNQSLSQLKIPRSDWESFLKLLLVSSIPTNTTHLEGMFQGALNRVLKAMSSIFADGLEVERISWKAFDTVISRCMVRILFSRS